MKRIARTTIGSLALLVTFGYSAIASGSVAIQFDPTGAAPGGTITVGSFDWIPGNAVNVGGNPSGGLAVGDKTVILSQSSLGAFLSETGAVIPVPAGTEFTFVMSVPVQVVAINGPNSPVYTLDLTSQDNFVEMWTSAPDANHLNGSGFNNGKRILFGLVTKVFGALSTTGCQNGPTAQFDQFPSAADNDYPGIMTVCLSGSTQISVNIISLDADYFPGFTPDQVANTKSFFNTSHILPFNQQNPSKLFVSEDAGATGSPSPAPDFAPILGPINGAIQSDDLDFQNQADANQSFEVGETIPGTCRVTYGGNDKNGNIDLTKFGSACSSDKVKDQNCYTFGGQVGAPTANPALGGPFGEHTHHNVSGPAGDFVFRAGTHSAPKTTRITATACKDPGACRQAEANAGFKQIDFEGTGSFRTLDPVAKAYLAGKAGHPVLPDNQDATIYYFRVDMDDTGEPGNKASNKGFDKTACSNFFAADLNKALGIGDPTLTSFAACGACADVYQFYICKDENPCEEGQAIYAVRGFLTGGNIQLHKVIK